VCGVRLVGKAGVMENGIEEITGAIPGEDSAGTIAAMRTGCQAERQDASFGITEPRDRTSPIRLVDIGAAFAFADPLAVFAKSWTALTCGDSFMKRCECGQSRSNRPTNPNRL
jgi:hypothetical protein